ncbi:hypothetical protein [Pseudonocardia alni]|uniref:Uncharacterized protein n=1 Tax=Pseudonocardia alni TaxID=33907 RepID=A0AA44UTS8_PSEA5|nr:hypothetical protein [Pseudonocardia alni]PKB33359.1 hypothetical protein ATL51_5116 [Pseudonocardia alni]
MSNVVLKLAQAIGIVVLAVLVVGTVIGVLQWLVVAAGLVALPVAGIWLYSRLSGRSTARPARRSAPRPTRADRAVTARRAELEGRAVYDAVGRCGWCGSGTRHQDRYGFPATPLAFHRSEIDAML